MFLRTTTFIATLVGLASAAFFPRDQNSGFVTLPQATIDIFTPYTYYAAAVKCNPQVVSTWQCGQNCAANPTFQVAGGGGDGINVHYWFVGYDSSLQTIIVAHQGTDKKKFFADLTGAKTDLTNLNSALFPNISSSILVHAGFANEQSQTANAVISIVYHLLKQYPSASVTTVGHSLGAALALLDGVYLRLQLPPQVIVKVVGYGMPRVGNRNFADFVDQILPNAMLHINNKKDPVPIVPGMNYGYAHPQGEIHIQEASGEWIKCPGHDNPDPRCTDGTVTSLSNAQFSDHSGPYNNVVLKC